MPIDDAELKRTIDELSLSLARQSIARVDLEKVHAIETARILTKISVLMGEDPDLPVEDLGDKFLSSVCKPPPFRQK